MTGRPFPGRRQVGVGDLPRGAVSLGTALSSAVRVEPELIRAVRLQVRPALDVGAEADVWYGPWAAHRGRVYMAFRQPVLGELRQRLVTELRGSEPGSLIRRAGPLIEAAHAGISPVLAMEERITWAALVAEAGVEGHGSPGIDDLLQTTLRAAVEQPHRRDGLRRWFSQAWHRLPARARAASGALDLYELLVAPSNGRFTGTGPGQGPSSRVPDVLLPVRHDGSRLTFGDPEWPADGILVPDTQPRILHISHEPGSWEDGTEVRVPRGGFAVARADRVPMYVRTSRGLVYCVGAPGGVDFISRPTPRSHQAGVLLGNRVEELDLDRYTRFGIAPRLDGLTAHPPLPRLDRPRPGRFDMWLRKAIETVERRHSGGLIAVPAGRGSGRMLAALHTMKAALPRWWVWVPPLIDRNQAVLRALGNDGIGSQTVLWLDNLDICLSDARDGEAVADALLDLLEDPGRHPVLVLAGLRDTETNEGRMGPAALMVMRTAMTNPDEVATGDPDRAYPLPYPVSRLPPRPPVLLGRQQELEQVLTALGRGGEATRFTAITGMTGIGKTTLAVTAARHAAERGWFEGGVLHVSVRGPGEPIRAALLRALGNPAGAGTEEWEPERLGALCIAQLLLTGGPDRPVLLVLDDVSEAQVAEAAELVPSGFTVLCVSGRAIELSYCPSLSLGPLDEDTTAQLLRLLWEQHRPGSHVPVPDVSGVARVCDGHPLAVVLASARLTGATDGAGGDRTRSLEGSVVLDLTDQRGSSLRATFDGIVAQLGRQHRKLFCLLSLLPGRSFSVRTIRSILPQAGDVESALADLARNLLIAPAGTDGRWVFQPLVQRYGRDLAHRVLTARETQIAEKRILDFFRTRAAAANRMLYGHEGATTAAEDRRAAFTWLRSERTNLVTLALERFARKDGQDAAAIALDIAQFLHSQQQYTSLMTLMERVYDWAEKRDESEAEATALNALAVSAAAMGDFQKARTALLRAAALPYAQRQRADYLLMLSNLGALLLRSHQADEAIVLLTDAISRHDRNQPVALLSLLCNLGTALHHIGDSTQARWTLEQAHQLASQYPIPPADKAPLFRNLADVFKDSGDSSRATTYYQRALDSLEEMDNQEGQAGIHEELARLHVEGGHIDTAITHLTRARRLHHQLGNTAAEAVVCDDLGLLHLEQGDLDRALKCVLDARNLYQVSRGDREAALALHNIGNILLKLERYSEAIPALRNANAHLEALGEQHGQAQALHKLGKALEETDDPLQAMPFLKESASLYGRLRLERACTGDGREGGGGGHPGAGVAVQGQPDDDLVEEIRSLRDDLLTLSHRLTRLGHDTAAGETLDAALSL